MSRFVRCPHCNLPHDAEETQCPVTGKAIALERKKRISRPPVAPVWRMSIPSGGEVEMEESPSVTRLFGMTIDNKYRLEDMIGRGGMGVVYRAEHIGLRRKVAVKVLLRGHGAGSDAKKRFDREARAAGRLGHPNIVQVFDLGTLPDGSPYLVMELLEGEPLSNRLAIEGGLPIPEACEIVGEVLSALEAAHAGGIVHRDLKPDNVFLTSDGRVKILDFGISKQTDETMSLTRTGAVVGTPYYLAPEQARGERAVDVRVDLWAAGVLAFECLTGMLPFAADNYNALLAKILTGRPTPPAQIRPSISPQLEAVVMMALAFDPENRFQSAAEMRQALLEAKDAPSPLEPGVEDVIRKGREKMKEDLSISSERPTVDLRVGMPEGDEEDPTEVSDSFVFSDVHDKQSPPATHPDYEGEPSIEVDFEVPPDFEAS